MNLDENKQFPHMMCRIVYLPKGSESIESVIVRDDRVLEEIDHLRNDLRCDLLSLDCLGYEKKEEEEQ